MSSELKIHGINGPVVTIKGRTSLGMLEMVYVGDNRLIGEVIGISDNHTVIQVYESTTGLRPGEIVTPSGGLMACALGPGMLRSIYDGIARPLEKIADISGPFIKPGLDIPAIDIERLWSVEIRTKINNTVTPGTVIATCQETPSIIHRIMIPPNLSGRVVYVASSRQYKATDKIVTIMNDKGERHNISLVQHWPIRMPRPIAQRLPINEPLITGQRVIDTLFPIAKGGASAIPGGFGTGKTMLQHQLAKYSDADIIIYVGCGERGNEMTQALTEFSELVDPRTGQSLLDRTVLIANTSNMPVAAREASIYTGITIAEYYRDMGYHVALMADSTSRWAEALREISGRLEEMPAEEGYPAYLPSRLAAFYERAGRVSTLNGGEGSITVIGAVSPQGNDFSEPVTQNTKRFTRCFWGLEKSLAYARHYPAVNWNLSYSEYVDELSPWFSKEVADDFIDLRAEIIRLLNEESELMEIVKLIGADLLADDQKLILEIARIIRVGFLQQNALHQNDSFVPIGKQYRFMKVIVALYNGAREITARQIPITRLKERGIFDKLIKSKYEIPNDELDRFDQLTDEINADIRTVISEHENEG
ncbi:MAG: V-type ATP synthase subunit A [Clostridiales bacterium]|nr:V-type ATP synthase subunit A [Clostridiales bacterium]